MCYIENTPVLYALGNDIKRYVNGSIAFRVQDDDSGWQLQSVDFKECGHVIRINFEVEFGILANSFFLYRFWKR